MNKRTRQQTFWQGGFGSSYTDRNTFSAAELDRFYKRTWGISRTEMNRQFLGHRKVENVLEVGANIGLQLRHLQRMGLETLHGIEIQADAVERAKRITRGINIIQGSALDLPYRDGYFDLVYTSGVLIHIHPRDLKKVMREMVRCSRRYIWGFEYFSDKQEEIPYRGNRNVLWKNDFPRLFTRYSNDLKLVKRTYYPYVEGGNVDVMYLFRKS